MESIKICTPDKDLAQSVSGDRVVLLDRRRKRLLNEQSVISKFGVLPESIPDYLALVGDSADGYPGIPGWGAISTAKVLTKFKHLETIPREVTDWKVDVSRAGSLAYTLKTNWDNALLFRRVATLVVDGPVKDCVDDLEWKGPSKTFQEICTRLESPDLLQWAESLAAVRNKTLHFETSDYLRKET